MSVIRDLSFYSDEEKIEFFDEVFRRAEVLFKAVRDGDFGSDDSQWEAEEWFFETAINLLGEDAHSLYLNNDRAREDE